MQTPLDAVKFKLGIWNLGLLTKPFPPRLQTNLDHRSTLGVERLSELCNKTDLCRPKTSQPMSKIAMQIWSKIAKCKAHEIVIKCIEEVNDNARCGFANFTAYQKMSCQNIWHKLDIRSKRKNDNSSSSNACIVVCICQ